ncbi:MAG: hypothetical protein QOK10_2774 [Pseudonocardiales bacterium]|nr:hypothetical protein [Pseudonocardiales bacterium]
MHSTRYADRDEAGTVLAGALSGYAGRHGVLVLGLPRGGVPVAARVASALRAELDIVVVRKLGLPRRPELAMGAIAGVGDAIEVVHNAVVLSHAAVSAEDFEAVYRREAVELRRRETAYRAGRPRSTVAGKVVIIVDDGLATGSTMRAAIGAVSRQRPAKIVAAAPAGARDTCEALREEVDEVVCPRMPEPFMAVGQAYRDFDQTSDEDVRRVLANYPSPLSRKLPTGDGEKPRPA